MLVNLHGGAVSMTHAVLRLLQLSHGRFLRLRQCRAPPNSDRTRKAGLWRITSKNSHETIHERAVITAYVSCRGINVSEADEDKRGGSAEVTCALLLIISRSFDCVRRKKLYMVYPDLCNVDVGFTISCDWHKSHIK